ncbi:MAG TPA: rhomboid family intramembrane serine protease [Verrucomicrobiae bacterium]|nr:rhomboid family intramembrane serine protease [Verrucomicrobiae bacterium]
MPAKASSNFARAILGSASIIAVLFLVKGIEVLFHLPLQQLGIVPRTVPGLIGIFCSPWLHGNMHHLLANSVPLFVLLVVLLSNPKYHPYRTLFFIWIASGVGTWLIGRGGAVHIGASSIVFGLAAFLIVAGLTMKSWRAATIAIFVFLFYGGIFYGALPQNGPISWEGHLCGAIAGAWSARRL